MRKEKQFLLDGIKEQITEANAFILFNYSGLKANDVSDFRGDVAKTGGGVEVVPKRVFIKAAAEAGVTLEHSDLPGHLGLVFTGEDSVATTKCVFEFGKASKAINVLGGRYDGELYSAKQVETLSKLPGKDEMRAQFLGLLEAPMARTLSVMDALVCSVVYCLDNKAKQGE